MLTHEWIETLFNLLKVKLGPKFSTNVLNKYEQDGVIHTHETSKILQHTQKPSIYNHNNVVTIWNISNWSWLWTFRICCFWEMMTATTTTVAAPIILFENQQFGFYFHLWAAKNRWTNQVKLSAECQNV